MTDYPTTRGDRLWEIHRLADQLCNAARGAYDARLDGDHPLEPLEADELGTLTVQLVAAVGALGAAEPRSA